MDNENDPTSDPGPADTGDGAQESPADPAENTTPATDANLPRRGFHSRLIVIAAVVLGVLVVAVAAVAYVQNRTGSSEDALQAIPGDSAFVMSVDLRHFTQGDRFDRLIAAIEPVIEEAEPGVTSWDEALDQLDAMLDEEMGMTLSDDVLPWIGRSIALSAEDFTEDEAVGMLFVVSLQDEDGARRFVEDVAAAEAADGVVERTPVVGSDTEAYVVDDAEFGDEAWVVIDGDLLIVASDQATLEKSLAAVGSGDSIADAEGYRTLVDELPADRGLGMFVSGEAITEMIEAEAALDDLGDDMDMDGFPVTDFALAAGITDLGVAVDFVAEKDESFGDFVVVAPPLAGELPADTLLYLGFAAETDPPTVGDLLREEDEALDDEFSAGLDFFGLGGLVDLLDHLKPELGLVVAPRPGGMPMEGAIPFDISVAVSLGIDDRDAVVAVLDEVVDGIEELGVVVEESDGVWEVFVDSDVPVVMWTVTEDSILIGTDAATLDRFGVAGDDAEETPAAFSELDEALPGEGLVFYLDVPGVAELFAGEVGPFAGFEAVAAGAEDSDDFSRVGMLLKFAAPSDGPNAFGD